MRFLVDENLPRRLAVWLRRDGDHALHVLDLLGAGVSDTAIWAAAELAGDVIVTRDNDFSRLVHPTALCQVVHLRLGNQSVPELLSTLEPLWPGVRQRLNAGERLVELTL